MKSVPSLLFSISLIISSLTHTQNELIPSALYGIAGYTTMYVSKYAAKRITDETFRIPKGTGNAIMALDFKFVLNAAFKMTLKGLPVKGKPGETAATAPLFFPIIFPEIDNKKNLKGQMFDSANKALSFVEFADYLSEVTDEMLKMSNVTVPESKPFALKKLASYSQMQEYVLARMKNAADYFCATAFTALPNDPAAALVAATYLFASWRVVAFTRDVGRTFTTCVTDALAPNSGSRTEPRPLHSKLALDTVISTTLGFMLTAALQNHFVTPALESGFEALGNNNTRTKKLAELGIRAGTKGPFAWDAGEAIVEGGKAYLPALWHHLVTRASAIGLTPILDSLFIAWRSGAARFPHLNGNGKIKHS